MHIYRINIKNFRSIENITIFPSKTNVIIGENNSGKTNILHAISLVLSPNDSSIRQLKDTDFPDWLNENERKLAINAPSVEIEFRYSEKDSDVETYDAILRGKVDHLSDGTCYFILKYTYLYDEENDEYKPYTYFVVSDNEEENMSNLFTGKHKKYFPYFYLSAQRDIKDEVRYSHNTMWGRYLKDIDITEQKESIIAHMNMANEALHKNEQFKLMAASIGTAVENLFNTESGAEIACTIASLNPDDLLKNTEINFKTPGSKNLFPVECHGHGTQNSIFYAVFKAYISYIKNKYSISAAFVGIEEPEAHLHPHAQRVLYRDIESLNTQTFITTHSTYITDLAEPESMIVLRKVNGKTTARQINTYEVNESGKLKVCICENDNKLSEKDINEIKRWISLEKSESYFSKCVYLCEGDTERLTIPIMAKILGVDFDKLGISFLTTGRGCSFTPFFKAFNNLNIKFVIQTDFDACIKIFRDCVKNGILVLDKSKNPKDIIDKKMFEEMIKLLRQCNIFCLLSDFEGLMFKKGHTQKYIDTINTVFGKDIFTEYAEDNPIAGKHNEHFNDCKSDEEKIRWIIKHRDREVSKVSLAYSVVSGFSKARDIPEEFSEIIEKAKLIASAV